MPHELRPGLLASPAIIQAKKYHTACKVTSLPELCHLPSVLGLSSFLISYVEMKNSFTAMALRAMAMHSLSTKPIKSPLS